MLFEIRFSLFLMLFPTVPRLEDFFLKWLDCKVQCFYNRKTAILDCLFRDVHSLKLCGVHVEIRIRMLSRSLAELIPITIRMYNRLRTDFRIILFLLKCLHSIYLRINHKYISRLLYCCRVYRSYPYRYERKTDRSSRELVATSVKAFVLVRAFGVRNP